jgi:hypothetical protein
LKAEVIAEILPVIAIDLRSADWTAFSLLTLARNAG